MASRPRRRRLANRLPLRLLRRLYQKRHPVHEAALVALGEQRCSVRDRVEERREPALLLGLGEVAQHVAEDALLVARVADAEADAAEVPGAEAGIDAAQAVVASRAAAELDADLAGGEVELVVEDDDVGGLDL